MKAQTMRRVRQYHQYVGVFFAPVLLLFATSGALQTFRIPDQPGAANWIVWLASFHKDQAPPHEKSAKPKPHHEPSADEQKQRAARPNPLPLKIFVLLMALGLITSTLLGVTIALNNRATRRSTITLLIMGTIVPCVLLWL
jgi:hypothetical protein